MQQQPAGQWGGGQVQAGGADAAGGVAQEEARSLWIGDLQYWMDENYLWNAFAPSGEVQTVKVIRNKVTGYSEGYGFIEFVTHATAQQVLATFNGALMPQTEQPFRMNWASFGMGGVGSRQQHDSPEFSIFVGDLAADVNDYLLTETFRTRYPSVRGAKVVVDTISARSKGYGFVRFGSEEERDRAMNEMNGQICSSRPMRISIATPKKPGAQGGGPGGGGGGGGRGHSHMQSAGGEEDPNNTTIFVGGLDQTVTDDQLRQVFGQMGELVYVKIPFGKGCGFVQFGTRSQAESAIRQLHGTLIGSQAVRLSWGRNPASKRSYPPSQGNWQQQQPQQQQQQQHDPNAAWGGAAAGYGGYGAYSGYGGYDQNAAYAQQGYGAAAYGGYGGYAGYAQPQQQQWPQTQPAAAAPATHAAAAAAAPAADAAAAPSGFGAGVNPNEPFDPQNPPSVDK